MIAIALLNAPKSGGGALSEHIFSMASHLINKLQACLIPENAGQILFVHRNIGWYEEDHDLLFSPHSSC
jgi:hypothetical protein